ncbi:MAG TPA: hypothetical protein VHP38_10785 [Ruminiclostridium sp.]|nr:hypothetical protein [Ruminiclostridium sp.]
MMTIKEDFCQQDKFYSDELRERVLDIFEYTCSISQLRKLIAEIREKAASLHNIILSEEELRKRKETLDYFDARMQSTVYYTLNNLEAYKYEAWKRLKNDGDDTDETVDPV